MQYSTFGQSIFFFLPHTETNLYPYKVISLVLVPLKYATRFILWMFISITRAAAARGMLKIHLGSAKNWLIRRPWCCKRLKAEGEGDDREWDGWMASLTWWTWVRVSSVNWWWTGRSGMLQSMGSQRVRHNWATELNNCWLQYLSNEYILRYNSSLDDWSLFSWNTFNQKILFVFENLSQVGSSFMPCWWMRKGGASMFQ